MSNIFYDQMMSILSVKVFLAPSSLYTWQGAMSDINKVKVYLCETKITFKVG